ncbi:MAG: hypothetical protein AUK47_04590 [Deltaproteobacteria bacterium CG2_30_63_29]|nr:MAG: hypothetical protein AUK47_04590 [Deltaproteobacteria bacterium CG2_30_63_29]
MTIAAKDVAARYRKILDTCTPYVISYTANWPYLDMAPMGVEIPVERRYTATSLESRDVVNGLHHLDSFAFGPQEMLMPRWVLFDCGEFPGMVFGFGKRASELSPGVRVRYHVGDDDLDWDSRATRHRAGSKRASSVPTRDRFVPLSMWVAIPCVEPGAWFGHNLSSANLVLGDDALPGLGTLTKLLGMKCAKVRKQYGATQWDSTSLSIHLTLGELELLSAYTPAHTHEETFSYLLEVDDARLEAILSEGWQKPALDHDRLMNAEDSDAIRALHRELEAGARHQLIDVIRGEPNQMRLRKIP